MRTRILGALLALVMLAAVTACNLPKPPIPHL